MSAVRALAAAEPARFRGSRGDVALGLLHLWHDHWEEAHNVAQSDEGEPDHDLLHALVHRREQDFSNAAYWFRGAGKNAAFATLGARAADLLADDKLRAAVLPDGAWNSGAFLQAVRRKENEDLLRALQAEEIIAFFETLAP